MKELALGSRQLTFSHFLHLKGIFDHKHDCCRPPTLLFSFPPTEDKIKGRHFDTTEMVEVEHDFQDAFTNGRSAAIDEYVRKGTTSRVIVAKPHN
jgi:hypothetical protein